MTGGFEVLSYEQFFGYYKLPIGTGFKSQCQKSSGRLPLIIFITSSSSSTTFIKSWLMCTR